MSLVFNPTTGLLDIVKGGGGSSNWTVASNVMQPAVDGDGILVDVPTASREAAIFKTTDDDTTKNLIELNDSSDATIGAFTATGRLGVTAAPVANTLLSINNPTYTTADTTDALYILLGSSSNHSLRGTNVRVTSSGSPTTLVGTTGLAGVTSGSNSVIEIYGLLFYTMWASSGTCTTMISMDAFTQTAGGTITNASIGRFRLIHALGTITNGSIIKATASNVFGTITTLKGLDLSGWSNMAGTWTTTYGIYADTSIDLGTTKYFIYSLSTSPSLFSGDIQLADGKNLVVQTTTGTKIGTSTSQKLGFFNATPVVQPSAYTPSNVTTDRSYDADATTLDELADVLGTLIADLQSLGLVG